MTICLVFMFLSWVIVCKWSKKVHFLQFCAELSKKSKSVEAIFIDASEISHYTLSKMLWFIAVGATVYEILAIKLTKKMLTQQNFSIISTSNTDISETVRNSILNNTILWKCVTKPSRCVYVNCFNRHRFEVSTKLQKMLFFRQFKDHNSGTEHGN